MIVIDIILYYYINNSWNKIATIYGKLGDELEDQFQFLEMEIDYL